MYLGFTSLIIMRIFIWKESICPISVKLGKQFIIGVLNNFPKFAVLDSSHVTWKRLITVKIFTKKWGTKSYIISILFVAYSMSPSKGFIIPPFNDVCILRVRVN